MPKLTADSNTDHASTVHSYDSYGRQIVSAVLAKAKAQLADGEAQDLVVPMEFRVTPTAMPSSQFTQTFFTTSGAPMIVRQRKPRPVRLASDLKPPNPTPSVGAGPRTKVRI